jgi:predicted nucleic-acid-binding Zn-ribbon protein
MLVRHTKESLQSGFKCPKCRNVGARVEEVDIGRAVARVIPLGQHRYLAVSCGLCGYTEFYNMTIAIPCENEKPEKASAALQENTDC